MDDGQVALCAIYSTVHYTQYTHTHTYIYTHMVIMFMFMWTMGRWHGAL